MKITAHHAHIFPEQSRADGTVDVLLRTMDTCGIEQCVTFAPFAKHYGDLPGTPNRFLAEAIRPNRERLFGFGVIDFEKGDLPGQVKEIRDLGFYGIKLHPAFQHFHVLGDAAEQVYDAAEKEGLFLTFHTGVHFDRIENYNILHFDEVAYRHPGLRFSMEHIGGYSFFREGLAVLTNNKKSPNGKRVFGGLTSVFDDNKPLWRLTEDEIVQAVKQAGDDTLIFGLDFPYNNAERTKADIRAAMSLPIPRESIEKIMGGNLRRILGLE